MKRRLFVKNTLSTATGAIVFPSIVPASVFGKNAPSNKIHVGIIGCGRIARSHNVPEILACDSALVKAVSDLDSRRMADSKQQAEEYYQKKTGNAGYVDVTMHDNYQDMLNPDIDAVIICTPDHWHAQPAIEAALARKDVYLQKPASLTVSEGRLISDVVRKQEVILQVGAQCHSAFPQYRKAAELVRNGRIGKITEVEIGFPGDPSGPGAPGMPVPKNLNYDMWVGSTPEVYYTELRVHPQKDYSRPGWLRCKQFGAGMITGWGSHLYDYSSWGMDTEYTGPISFEAVAQFPKSGLWDVHGNYAIKSEYKNGITMHTGSGFTTGVRYKGEDGWIFVSHVGDNTLDASDPKILNSEIKENEIRLYPSDDHHENWLECIKNRKQPISPVEVGHRACSIGLLGHIAMQVPGKLEWDPEIERFKNSDLANSMLKRPQRDPYGTDYIKGI